MFALFLANLLVIQHLETLYLGGNHVRVVNKKVWRKTQECALSKASWLNLATVSRLANRQRRHTCEACRGAEESRQLEHYKTKLLVWPGSWLTTQTRNSVKLRGQVTRPLCMGKTDISHSKHTPIWIPLIPTYCRELLERILREKP